MASSTLRLVIILASACCVIAFQPIRLKPTCLLKGRSTCATFPTRCRAPKVCLRVAQESSVEVDPNDLAKLLDAGMMESDALKVKAFGFHVWLCHGTRELLFISDYPNYSCYQKAYLLRQP